jgi:hypothetical protein
MSLDTAESQLCFGFLSVGTVSGNALIGGYLLLNSLGRPLEFHCTEAVRPTRAQEILYGPTLVPYLHADQLGRSLVQSSNVKPRLLFVDSEATLELRAFVECPVLWVRSAESGSTTSDLNIGSNLLTVSHIAPGDHDVLLNEWEQKLASWNLAEPFSRIREAINEMQKAA